MENKSFQIQLKALENRLEVLENLIKEIKVRVAEINDRFDKIGFRDTSTKMAKEHLEIATKFLKEDNQNNDNK